MPLPNSVPRPAPSPPLGAQRTARAAGARSPAATSTGSRQGGRHHQRGVSCQHHTALRPPSAAAPAPSSVAAAAAVSVPPPPPPRFRAAFFTTPQRGRARWCRPQWWMGRGRCVRQPAGDPHTAGRRPVPRWEQGKADAATKGEGSWVDVTVPHAPPRRASPRNRRALRSGLPEVGQRGGGGRRPVCHASQEPPTATDMSGRGCRGEMWAEGGMRGAGGMADAAVPDTCTEIQQQLSWSPSPPLPPPPHSPLAHSRRRPSYNPPRYWQIPGGGGGQGAGGVGGWPPWS